MEGSSKNEKRLMLFDMQEHPERYTDEQVKNLLADADVAEFLREMSIVRMAQMKANPEEVDVDKAWKDFSADKDVHGRKAVVSRSVFKVVAPIMGVALLSGIAIAAIRSGVFRSFSTDVPNSECADSVSGSIAGAELNDDAPQVTEKADTADLKTVVFDNVEIEEVLSQMADFYDVKVEFEDPASRHIRVFFNWDKATSLDRNIKILNAFDRIHITKADGILKVE